MHQVEYFLFLENGDVPNEGSRQKAVLHMVRFRSKFVLKLTLYFICTKSVRSRWRRPQIGNTLNKSELMQIYERFCRRWASASGRSSCPECRLAAIRSKISLFPLLAHFFQNRNLACSRTGPTPSRGEIMRMRVIRKQSLFRHTLGQGRFSVGVQRPVCAAGPPFPG